MLENLGLLAIATTAFLGSLGHCIGMCGGFVLAYSSTKVKSVWSQTDKTLSHTLYNLGRTLSYAVIGAVVGALGSIFTLNVYARASLYLAAAVVMALVALWLFGYARIAKILEYDFTKVPFFKKSFQNLLRSDSKISFLKLGVLNGFFPCGLVYFFASSAAASGSAVSGALIMTIFGLSTFAPMFTLAYASSLLQNGDFRRIASKISALMIMGFAAYTAYGAIVIFFDLPI